MVSILVPCFNADGFVGEALTSAISQTYADKEIIVINDGSTDKSLDVLESFGNKIKLFSRENRGGNFTRNELLRLARGEWVQYLDADDYLDPCKLHEQMEWIERNPDCDVVYGAVMKVDDEGHNRTYAKQDVIFPEDPWSALISWQLPQTSSPLFKRQALLDVGGWKDDQKVCQEHELYLRLLKARKSVIGVKGFQHLTHYRQWSTDTVSKRDILTTYRTRIEIMEMAYRFMKEHEMLTDERNIVFLEWCILVARGTWSRDKRLAEGFYNKYKNIYDVASLNSKFLNPKYITMLKFIGFSAAERIAQYVRKSL